MKKWSKSNAVIGEIFDEVVKRYPNKKAFVSADTGDFLTFQQASDLSNKIANIFRDAGYVRGDTVAVIMENRIEYVPLWVGLSRIGVTASLINFNLKGNSLNHCLKVSTCKGVIFTAELNQPLAEVQAQYEETRALQMYCFDDGHIEVTDAARLQDLMKEASTVTPPRPEGASLSDELLHVYTSGTTGLPKAAVIRGYRAMYMCGGMAAGTELTPDDVIYNALPLYHSNGGVGMAANAVRQGNTVVIRKKFSASRYFEDCSKYEATVINYIGEICRYLLATNVGEFDKKHKIRIATGNGLRASIWKEFQERFNIPLCAELYGSTEGNANMMNITGKVGSVGFSSVIAPFIFPIKLIKVDKETGEVLRDSNGMTLPCAPGEVGMLVGKVKNDVMHRFDGYVNKEATQKKVIQNVFGKGDSAFLTGDMLVQDEQGFYYFQDRTGDTFRWKGENVSTNEVEGVISKSLKLSDVCVYGVEVPGIEGRAGMACIKDPEKQVDMNELRHHVDEALPPYARPVFIRRAAEIAVTATFKFQKTKLRDEGFEPSKCGSDDLFYFNGKEKKFLPIDDAIFNAITNKEIRF